VTERDLKHIEALRQAALEAGSFSPRAWEMFRRLAEREVPRLILELRANLPKEEKTLRERAMGL